MLHTSRTGMGEQENQDYVRDVLERFPRLRIILAHMGRYLAVEEFFRFCDSGPARTIPCCTWRCLSASRQEVYARVLGHRGDFWPPAVRLGPALWPDHGGGSRWSRGALPIFLARDQYPWSNPALQEVAGLRSDDLTYNTYHTIKALKDALDAGPFPPNVRQRSSGPCSMRTRLRCLIDSVVDCRTLPAFLTGDQPSVGARGLVSLALVP